MADIHFGVLGVLLSLQRLGIGGDDEFFGRDKVEGGDVRKGPVLTVSATDWLNLAEQHGRKIACKNIAALVHWQQVHLATSVFLTCSASPSTTYWIQRVGRRCHCVVPLLSEKREFWPEARICGFVKSGHKPRNGFVTIHHYK